MQSAFAFIVYQNAPTSPAFGQVSLLETLTLFRNLRVIEPIMAAPCRLIIKWQAPLPGVMKTMSLPIEAPTGLNLKPWSRY
jgi:hypothetical protein